MRFRRPRDCTGFPGPRPLRDGALRALDRRAGVGVARRRRWSAGFLLLRNERTAFRARTVAALHGEQSLLRGLVDSGRKVLAAMLLILPGVVSDLVALLLLALPINVGRRIEAAASGPALRRHRRRLAADRLSRAVT